MNKLWSDNKSFDEIILVDSDEAIVNLHEDVLCLQEDLKIANALINKIQDKTNRGMT
jgi:hypothetical protein